MRTLAVMSMLLVLAPAADVSAAKEPPRLTYSLVVEFSALPGRDLPYAGGGICVARPNGGEADRVTTPTWDSGPSWSPDGRQLAFSRAARLVVLGTRGRTEVIAEYANRNEEPAWSPDGRWIAFANGAYGSAISLIRPDGSDQRDVVPGGWQVFARHPAWSPNGRTIAFWEHDQTSDGAVFLVDREGQNRRKLVDNGLQPTWSPDGRWIAFQRRAWSPFRSGIAVIRADGRDERLLTEHGSDPAWSPDGKWIAFERQDGTDTDIVLMRPDGSELHVAAGSALSEQDPAWRPSAPRNPGSRRPCVLRGTSRGDTLRGTPFGDLILGGGGLDVIHARGGNDVVDGGPGSDLILGDWGKDLILGGFGSDRLFGGGNSDYVVGAHDGERDLVDGGLGRDIAAVDQIDRVRSIEATCPNYPC